MDDLQRIESRLDTIEGLLRQLLGRSSVPGHGLPEHVLELKGEIASVRAAGGDLVQYFKDKARADMRAGRNAQ